MYFAQSNGRTAPLELQTARNLFTATRIFHLSFNINFGRTNFNTSILLNGIIHKYFTSYLSRVVVLIVQGKVGGENNVTPLFP